jgi:hypothetical protein
VSYGLISVVGLGKYKNKRNGLVVGLLHVIRLKWAWFSSGWPVRKAQWPKACLVASSLLGRWIRQGKRRQRSLLRSSAAIATSRARTGKGNRRAGCSNRGER